VAIKVDVIVFTILVCIPHGYDTLWI